MKKLVFIILILGGCSTLTYPPPLTPAVKSLPPAASGAIAEAAHRFTQTHPSNQSGFLALIDNQQAFTWRLALVDHAVQSIDVQYFIWRKDAAGSMLFDRLLKAADRFYGRQQSHGGP